MLRHIAVDTTAQGHPVNVPVRVDEAKLDQYVKRFIEIAAYNLQDGSGVVALFRHFHGGTWTVRILEAILQELQHPTLHLNLPAHYSREHLYPFFDELFISHQYLSDIDFQYPPKPAQRASLPL